MENMNMATRRLTAGQRRHDEAAAALPPGQASLWGTDLGDDQDASRAGVLAETAGARWSKTLGLVVRSGAGLTISGTRDGGALSLTLLNDGLPAKRYATTADELARMLDTLDDYCSDRL